MYFFLYLDLKNKVIMKNTQKLYSIHVYGSVHDSLHKLRYYAQINLAPILLSQKP